jgi:hypothetical protein
MTTARNIHRVVGARSFDDEAALAEIILSQARREVRLHFQ